MIQLLLRLQLLLTTCDLYSYDHWRTWMMGAWECYPMNALNNSCCLPWRLIAVVVGYGIVADFGVAAAVKSQMKGLHGGHDYYYYLVKLMCCVDCYCYCFAAEMQL